jgi:5-methylcytosine-specific restriction endonuclease McrA
MECLIGRRLECGLQGCAFKRAGATDCKDRIESTIIPKYKTAKTKKVKQKDYICYYCNKPLTFSKVTKDHVIAKSLGGTSHGKNIVDCCKECNRFKSNMSLEVFETKLRLILKNVNKLTTKNK